LVYCHAMPDEVTFDDNDLWWCRLCRKTFVTREGMDSMPNECIHCEYERGEFRLGEPYDGQDKRK